MTAPQTKMGTAQTNRLQTGDRVHVRPAQATAIGLPGVTIRGAEAVVVRLVDDLVLVECVYRPGRRLVSRQQLIIRRRRTNKET